MDKPVAFFVFNRPDHTRRVLARIRDAAPSRLLVVADGPRPQVPADERLCAQVRAAIAAIDWPCEVRTEFAPTNLGVRQRFATGLDWVFGQVDAAIVLEDDCLPHPSFFPFCAELLDRYRDEPRVQMIGGANFTPFARFTRDSYYFSRWYHIWGWATWARAWRQYDVTMQRWQELRETDWLERLLPFAGMPRVARWLFDQTWRGDRDAWDYPWVLAGWLQGAHAIVPSVNLVTNIGFGAGATTTRSAYRLGNLPDRRMQFPLRHPCELRINELADFCEWAFLHPAQLMPPLVTRVGHAIARQLRRWSQTP